MAAAGYPLDPKKGDAIRGIPAEAEDCKVFHAGTASGPAGGVVTSGGRVLCVTALGDSVRNAQQRAYDATQSIQYAGMQYRRDIGYRAIKRAPHA
jgi:phosphoribosylamine--glycine ligase